MNFCSHWGQKCWYPCMIHLMYFWIHPSVGKSILWSGSIYMWFNHFNNILSSLVLIKTPHLWIIDDWFIKQMFEKELSHARLHCKHIRYRNWPARQTLPTPGARLYWARCAMN
jgi:hypothetical protein